MKPWTFYNGKTRPTDAFIIPLWASFKPKDFYIALLWHKETRTTTVYVVPSEFYDRNGCMFEDSIPIVQHLPNYMEEVLEGVYEADNVPIDVVSRDLFKRGFSHNHYFQRFIDGSGRSNV